MSLNIQQLNALLNLYPQTVKTVNNTAYDAQGNEVFYDLSVVQAYVDSQAYKQQRAQAYPSIADQLDLIYHDGIDAWKEVITQVKEEYPKP